MVFENGNLLKVKIARKEQVHKNYHIDSDSVCVVACQIYSIMVITFILGIYMAYY